MAKEREPVVMTSYGREIGWIIIALAVTLIVVGSVTGLEITMVKLMLTFGSGLVSGLFWGALASGEWSQKPPGREQIETEPQLIGCTIFSSLVVVLIARAYLPLLDLSIEPLASIMTIGILSGMISVILVIGLDRFLRWLADRWLL